MMATVVVDSKANTAQRPARSLTYPLRDPKNGNPHERKKQSKQIDPDELIRRLEAHVAEQKRQAEQRRSKAVAKKGKESAYHHVPKVAAAAFERTATPVLMGEKEGQKKAIHKLGHVALRQYADDSVHSTKVSYNLQETLALDQLRKHRELVGERNQFQRTRQLEEAARLDKEKNPCKGPQRAFMTDSLDIPQVSPCVRPLSTGDIIWGEDVDANDPGSQNSPKAKGVTPVADRQDWEQCDQVHLDVHRSVKERMSPFLRKTDSIWILKGRKGPKLDNMLESRGSAPTGDIKQKKTFFGFFKR